MTLNKVKLRSYLLILLFALLLVAPLFLNPYHETVMIAAAVAIILAVGFRLLFTAGRFTLAQAGFLCIGAYTSALLSTKCGVDFWFCLIASGMAAALGAVVFGYFALRLGGIYFVIASLAVAECLRHFVIWAVPLTGGNIGVINIPAPTIHIPGVVHYSFGVNQTPFYYLILVILVICIFVTYRMENSRIGMAFRCMRQNPLLAEHVGINLTRYRILAWATGCFFTGLAGSFTAHHMHYVSPDDFTLTQSLYAQVYAIIGGLGGILGPIVGGAFTIFLSEGLRLSKEAEPAIYGALIIATMILLPGGLITLPSVIRHAGGNSNDKEKQPKAARDGSDSKARTASSGND